MKPHNIVLISQIVVWVWQKKMFAYSIYHGTVRTVHTDGCFNNISFFRTGVKNFGVLVSSHLTVKAPATVSKASKHYKGQIHIFHFITHNLSLYSHTHLWPLVLCTAEFYWRERKIARQEVRRVTRRTGASSVAPLHLSPVQFSQKVTKPPCCAFIVLHTSNWSFPATEHPRTTAFLSPSAPNNDALFKCR